MSTYEPGSVAVATVRGVPNVRVMCIDDENFPWIVDTGHRQKSHDVTDIRPLVVLDLDPALDHMGGGMSDLPEVLKDMRHGGGIFADRIANQIEAQTKPPRIPEPGWGGIVEASVREHDMRPLWTPNDQGFWACKDPDEYARNWGELIDPTLVRPGVEDEQ